MPNRNHLVLLFSLLVLGAVACGPTGGHQEADGVDDHADVVQYPVPDDATISFIVWIKAGSMDDPAGKEGLASLVGSLISDGATTNNSYEDILEKLYPLASGYGVRVDKEMTTISGRTHKDNIDRYLPLLADAVLRPAFTAEDFDRLKSDQKNFLEKTLRYASDEELGKAALTSAVFAGTRYAHPVEGAVGGLDAITLDDVKQFYASRFTRENTVLAIGGGYDRAALDRFAGFHAELPEGTPPTRPSIAPANIEGRSVLLVDKADADSSISFGFPIDVSRGDRDFYALWIANSWLGEHRNSSSHLYQVIRETRGMNYGDYSYIEAFPGGGFRQMPPPNVGRNHQLFEVWIRTLPNEQAMFALRAALREVRLLVDEGMTEEEFELTRSFLRNYHLHFAETTAERLGYAVDDRFYGIGGDGHLAQFGRMLEELTREDVNAALKRHLQVDNLKIAIVTGDASGLQEILTTDTPTPMTYASTKSDEVLAEDVEIAKEPLSVASDAVTVVPVDDIFDS